MIQLVKKWLGIIAVGILIKIVTNSKSYAIITF